MIRKALLGLALFPIILHAQSTNILRVNPLGTLSDHNTAESYFLYSTGINVTFEKNISQKFNPYLGINLLGPFSIDAAKGELNENIPSIGYGVLVGNRIYSKKENYLSGFYFSQQISYSNIRFTEIEDKNNLYLKLQDITCSLFLGYQLISEKKWIVDFYLGTGLTYRNYYDNTLSESISVIDANHLGIRPQMGIFLGRCFK